MPCDCNCNYQLNHFDSKREAWLELKRAPLLNKIDSKNLRSLTPSPCLNDRDKMIVHSLLNIKTLRHAT